MMEMERENFPNSNELRPHVARSKRSPRTRRTLLGLPSSKCLLCRDNSRTRSSSLEGRSENVLTNWNKSCAQSLRQFLNLDISFQEPLAEATYCQECICIIRDIDFCLKAIKSLQRRLKRYRPTIESNLKNNHLWIQQENGDLDTANLSPYDHLIHSICQATSLVDLDEETKFLVSDLNRVDAFHQTVPEPATQNLENVVIKTEFEAETKFYNDSDPDFVDSQPNFDDDSDWTASETAAAIKLPRRRQKTKKKTNKTIRRSVTATKTENETLTCSTCNTTFVHRSKFQKHVRDHERSKTKVAFRCSTCDKKYVQSQEQEYNAHVELHQLNFKEEYNFSCVIPNCGKICVNSIELKHHVLKMHEDTTNTKCDICGQISSNPARLKRHKIDMHTEKPESLKCTHPNCSYHANSASDLKHHSFKHLAEKAFTCTICNKKYTWKNSLRLHMKMHDTHKEFKCSFANCGKLFSLRTYLQRHENSVHCTIRNYLCSSCPKSFKSDKSLQQHIRFFHLRIRARSALVAQGKQKKRQTERECPEVEARWSNIDTGLSFQAYTQTQAQGFQEQEASAMYLQSYHVS